MNRFILHTDETASDEAKALFKQSKALFGVVPNLHKILAEAPVTYQAYMDIFNGFNDNSSFTPLEQQVIYLAVSVENACHNCVPGHSWLLWREKGPDDVAQALRDNTPLADERLAALRDFTLAVWRTAGKVDDATLDAFFSAGFSRKQALELLTALAAKLISNFGNALAQTPMDKGVKRFAWQPTAGPDENDTAVEKS